MSLDDDHPRKVGRGGESETRKKRGAIEKSKKKTRKKSKYNDREHRDKNRGNDHDVEEEEEEEEEEAEIQSNNEQDDDDGDDNYVVDEEEEEDIEENEEDEDDDNDDLPSSRMGSSTHNQQRRRREETRRDHPHPPMTKAQGLRIDGNGHRHNHRDATLLRSKDVARQKNGKRKATTTSSTTKRMKFETNSRGGVVGDENGRRRMDNRDNYDDRAIDGDGGRIDDVVQGTRGVESARKRRKRTRDRDRLFRHRLLLPVNFNISLLVRVDIGSLFVEPKKY